jgi:hypothetical protein
MLDSDLAKLYGVTTKVFNQAVKRNKSRFPADFMFELPKEEAHNLRSQIVTSNWGGSRYLPSAFTEQGVAMLSGVLNSEQAININIQIIRIFTRMRQMLSEHSELRMEIDKIKKKLDNHDKNIEVVFSYLDELLDKRKESVPRRQIGFKVGKK